MPTLEPQRPALAPIAIEEVRAARARLAGIVPRTPLVRLFFDAQDRDEMTTASPAAATVGWEPAGFPAEIHLKLENLQPIGSFKLRGAGNAMQQLPRSQLQAGVWTASAGNMAQGVAWTARRLGVPCTTVVPDTAPRTKLAAIERLGGRIVPLPFDDWWSCIRDSACAQVSGTLVHPVNDPAVVAGNGTIGLEILDDLADVDTVVIPYGGGGLSIGIASAIRALKPDTRIYACEVETASPLAAAFAAGAPRDVERIASFVDGIGSNRVLQEMWPEAQRLLDGSLVVSLAEVCDAIRFLAERCRVIAEGAGAAAVAAAMTGRAGRGKVVCVVSGGNIDKAVLSPILRGEMPPAP